MTRSSVEDDEDIGGPSQHPEPKESSPEEKVKESEDQVEEEEFEADEDDDYYTEGQDEEPNNEPYDSITSILVVS